MTARQHFRASDKLPREFTSRSLHVSEVEKRAQPGVYMYHITVSIWS